jgi:AcrR family transcriptional regulator
MSETKLLENQFAIDTPAPARILEAAKTVFLRKGLDATKMQDIAYEADISRTALHYYYRTKEALFKAIFDQALNILLPKLNEIIYTSAPFSKKLEVFVESYTDMLLENPLLPRFILLEMQRNPENLIGIIKSKELEIENIDIFEKQLNEEIAKGNIRNITMAHFFSNLYALCIFPFLARPILSAIFFENDEEKVKRFILERKKIITETILLSLRP